MSETASKRDQLLDAAGRLFASEGFHATGIDRILEEAGVAKMTLYNHFRSKEDLILASLRRMDEQWRLWFCRRVESAGEAPRQRILACFDALHEWLSCDAFDGCVFAKAIAEYGSLDGPIGRAAREHKLMLREYVLALLEQTGIDEPDELATEVTLLMDGAIARVLAGCDPDAALAGRRACDRLLCCAGVE